MAFEKAVQSHRSRDIVGVTVTINNDMDLLAEGIATFSTHITFLSRCAFSYVK